MTDASFNKIIEAIYRERQRQDGKWGEQNHEAPMWKLILDEELGETAKSYLESNYSNYIGELIQSAAVIVAWLESEFRNMNSMDAEEIDRILAERTKGVKGNSNISTKNNLEVKEPDYTKVLQGLPPEIRERLMYGKFGTVNYDKYDNTDGNDDKDKKD